MIYTIYKIDGKEEMLKVVQNYKKLWRVMKFLVILSFGLPE